MRRSTNALFLEFNRDIYRYDIEYIPIPDRERERINQFETACYLSNSMFPKLFFSNSPPPETTSYWPKNIFLKLFFSNFFSYERCIYLDGDTVCVNNIRRLWNIDLGEHCFAGLVRQSNSFWVINAGCLLYDLQKMKNVSFASEIEEILKQNQKNPSHHTEALEEHALYAYSAKHGHYVIGPEFNMGKDVVPYEFNEVIEKDNKHPTIVHYYGRPKPPEIIKRYEKVNCPDYKNLQHPFWKSYWKYSPWAFWVWCKYYKKYCEIKDLTKLDW
jgi:lipopolysaccharide biosynthesis glycosyltransferase